jgi:hypothetical protein
VDSLTIREDHDAKVAAQLRNIHPVTPALVLLPLGPLGSSQGALQPLASKVRTPRKNVSKEVLREPHRRRVCLRGRNAVTILLRPVLAECDIFGEAIECNTEELVWFRAIRFFP